MATYKAFSPAAEINGQTILATLNSILLRNMALEALCMNGIDDPKPNQWYPQQAWLNAFRHIEQQVGSGALFQIGTQIPANATFPPSIDSITKALASIDIAYHINHRNGEIGCYKFVSTGPRAAQIICNNPYPCDLDRGIITSMATLFKPKGSEGIKVVHNPGACRQKGADICAYTITW